MSISERKRDHLRAFDLDPEIERGGSGFASIRLTHRALPEINFDEIDTRTEFLGKALSFPLIIGSMTGGADEEMMRINRHLAEAAEACQVGLAVGSQRIMFRHPKALRSFALRDLAPTIPLLGNLGAVQLNKGFTLEHAEAAVSALQADGLYLHLNPLQEAIQPEGDLQFAGLSEKIMDLSQRLSVPVCVKEVGAGLSSVDIGLLAHGNIAYFDVAGRGGTSWSRIEYHRSNNDLGLLFQDWGLTTVEALCMAKANHPNQRFIASGGIRSGIDIAKALILGAEVCTIAAPFLKPAQESTEAVIRVIKTLHQQYQTALFLLGCINNKALINQHHLIIGGLPHAYRH
ncbi:MAG: type 2 isopentenyl-diphosphate Delta-isomerase [Cardiobacteriaceae bacterium]|nr:type 2 isopentenyl-diphosphate Delta-isomerase [Cardiobacteriaceae bacterium]